MGLASSNAHTKDHFTHVAMYQCVVQVCQCSAQIGKLLLLKAGTVEEIWKLGNPCSIVFTLVTCQYLRYQIRQGNLTSYELVWPCCLILNSPRQYHAFFRFSASLQEAFPVSEVYKSFMSQISNSEQ